MNIIMAQIYKAASRVKVVHALPGRMRVHIPLLKKLNNSRFMQYEVFLISKLKELEGIRNVKCCFITGNVLIEYTEESISKNEIVSWFDVIRDTLTEYFLSNPPLPEDIEKEKELVSKLTSLINYRIRRLK